MASPQEMKDFLSKVDSIQSKFMESIITRRRDAIFQEKEVEREPAARGKSRQNRINSQRVGAKQVKLGGLSSPRLGRLEILRTAIDRTISGIGKRPNPANPDEAECKKRGARTPLASS
jgi:hypothetical protein